MSRHQDYRERLRKQVLEAYGNKCSCCAETHHSMLHIDHVKGNGSEERKRGLRSTTLCKFIIENKYPKAYRILCANCNMSREHHNGKCPHTKETPEFILKRINHWKGVLKKLQLKNAAKTLPKNQKD